MRYLELAELYQKLEKTSKRLEKTHLISVFLKEIPNEELSRICLLLQGRLFLAASEEKIGVASKLILKAINVATGVEQTKIEKEWKKTGDLGVTIEELCGKKRQQTLASSVLTVKKVFENLQKLAEMEGEGTVDKKVKLIAELLSQATPGEARYIVRTVLEDLRVGVGDGTLRDAIVWAFFNQEVKINYNQEAKSIEPENREQYNSLLASAQKAYDLTTDWGHVALQAKEKGLSGLKKTTLTIGNPTKVMLCQKAKDMEEAFEMVGKPAAFEFKYDGFRLLVHKKGDQIWLFTRRLENVSKQFPEVVKYIKEGIKAEVVVLDSEAVGYDAKTGRYLPFQNISQRIKRKYNIEQMAHDFPVELNVFDVLVYGNEHQNENLMNTPYQERRKLLEKIVKEQPKKLRLAKQLVTGDLKKAQAFYDSAVQSGEEGLIAKNLESIY
ncbi:TPA: ATP-dependent DNA ligase, partial [Candidatus Woesearchaeota archaeon]|nr:ATP-dependent DNA ligase [Candidatus Woesearchaeota archaeon]